MKESGPPFCHGCPTTAFAGGKAVSSPTFPSRFHWTQLPETKAFNPICFRNPNLYTSGLLQLKIIIKNIPGPVWPASTPQWEEWQLLSERWALNSAEESKPMCLPWGKPGCRFPSELLPRRKNFQEVKHIKDHSCCFVVTWEWMFPPHNYFNFRKWVKGILKKAFLRRSQDFLKAQVNTHWILNLKSLCWNFLRNLITRAHSHADGRLH